MKTLWISLIAALTTVAAGCATTSPATRQPTAEEYEVLVQALKRQNAELRRRAERPADPVPAEVATPVDGRSTALALPPVPPPVRPEDMIPPPAQPRRVPPQNWAWLHQPPAGCTSGIYSMQVENWTDHHIQLFVDGEELRVRGSRGVLPGIPPHEVVYICLNNIGQHTFTGMVFALRYGQPQRVGRYRYQGNWDGASLWAPGRQQLIIRANAVTWEQ